MMPVVPDMVGIVCKDLNRSLDFYRLLGLDIPEQVSDPAYFEIISNGYRISWNTEDMIKSFHPEWQTPQGQRASIAYLCDSPAEVDAVYQRLVDAGYHGSKAPWDAFWGQRYALILDPDGLQVELFAKL
jgi:catechol 2,3-dioxygenase-like lactoylglutathione lyase family enzyme